MHRVMVIAVTLLATAMTAVASAQSSDLAIDAAKKDVIEVHQRLWDAYRTCNLQELEGLLVDDAFFWHATGTVQQSKAEVLNGIRPTEACVLDDLRVDPRSVRILGDTAIVYGDLMWKLKNRPATEPGKHIAVTTFVRRNGRWLFASSVTAPVPERTASGPRR